MSEVAFNLPAPHGFRGLDPRRRVRIYQRNLPHWRQAGATYFITFRLADSIPQTQLQALRRWRAIWESAHPEPRCEDDWRELAREITNKTEAWLDEGYGACELGLPQIAELVQECLCKFQEDRYLMSCYSVLPNHVHALLKPLDSHELEVILRDMKGYIARRTNEMLNRRGVLWSQETFDRIIRDEEHLYRVVQYIGNNPAKAGLPQSRWCRWIHPQWQKAGWSFKSK